MKKIIFALLSIMVMSAQANECKRIGHKDGKTHEFQSMINNYTHIELPENIMKDTKPLVGNSELWVSDHAGPHIFIKPTSQLSLGTSTSLSVVGESSKSYNFKIVRRNQVKNTCYKLTDGVLFSNSERSALTRKRDPKPGELAALWKDKYLTLAKDLNTKKQQAVRDALRRYRFQIYTRYDWDQSHFRKGKKGHTGSKGFIGKGLVSDIYDDGRFTYIRISEQNKGLLMVEANLEGQTEIIDPVYDPLTKIYTISGIYPELNLKYGSSNIKLTRADNTTVGEY